MEHTLHVDVFGHVLKKGDMVIYGRSCRLCKGKIANLGKVKATINPMKKDFVVMQKRYVDYNNIAKISLEEGIPQF